MLSVWYRPQITPPEPAQLRSLSLMMQARMRLFVGNLPWEYSSEDLHRLFTEFGEVIKASVIKDRVTGRSRGFGFVDMTTKRQGKAAAEGLNGSVVGGRPLTVNPARQRITNS